MSGTDYFSYSNLIANSLARASDVNARMAAIQGGFALLPVPTKLQQDRTTYCVDSGNANAIAIALDFPPAAYSDGLTVKVKLAASNTGAATLNVNGLGAKTITRFDGSTLAAGDLVAGHIAVFIYNGSGFQLVSPAETVAASYASAAAASATSASTSATAAASSASSASTSASAAATSATNAAASASSASTSATNASNSAATVAASLGNYVPIAGGVTMTGRLTMLGDPIGTNEAATKHYVDSSVAGAGGYTADGTTITLAAAQFSLTTIANNSVLGNVSGITAKPGALTATQLTALANTFTTTLKGLVPSPGSVAGKVLSDNGTWVTAGSGTVTSVSVATANGVSGSVATSTTTPAITLTLGAITPTSVAASGSVTGSNLSGTNTGDQYTSIANNRMLGNVSGASAAAIALTSAQVNTFLGLAAIATSGSAADITAGTLAVARGGTGVTTATGTGSVVLSASPALSGTPTAPTAATATSTTQVATTAFVQANIATCAAAFLVVTSISGARTLGNVDNNSIIFCTGASGFTITANSTPTVGFSCILAFTSTAAWTFACASGVYTDGATATVTSVSIPAGSRCTAIHKGAGVWLLSGV